MHRILKVVLLKFKRMCIIYAVAWHGALVTTNHATNLTENK